MKIFIQVIVPVWILLFNVVQAQSSEERNNRAVYNQIEFFFNTQQPDSIYNLASEIFRTNAPQSTVEQIVTYFGQFGRISDSEVLGFNQGVAEYGASIGEKYVRIQLSVDSNLRYTLLSMQEVPGASLKTKDEPVISDVKREDTLDHFVDSVARTYIQQLNTQSLSIGLISGSQVKTFFYGETAEGNGTVPTPNSIYEIGSITKTFTATLLANLVENNVIQLDDSIAKFLPDSVASNPFVQKLTFRTLANHTSGLPRLPDNMEESADFDPANPYAHYGRKEMFDFLKHFTSEVEPGEQFEYSNYGYGLLGELVSIIENKPFHELVRDSITAPLNMTNTVQKLDPKTQQLILPHASNGDSVTPWTFDAMSGAGALRSTVNDLLRYAHAQFQLPETTLERAMMLTRQFSFFIPPNTDIGLAWHMNILGDVIYYWHNGRTAGSSSFLALAPDKQTALVVLSNSSRSVDEIAGTILHRIMSAD